MKRLLGVGVFLLLQIPAQGTLAANVLFTGQIEQMLPGFYFPRATGCPAVEGLERLNCTGNPGMAMVTPASPAAGFTLRDAALSGTRNETCPTFTAFCYTIAGYIQNRRASFGAGVFTGTVTLLPDNAGAEYPYATQTPRLGSIRMRAGPNGFAGYLPIRVNHVGWWYPNRYNDYYSVSFTIDVLYGSGTGAGVKGYLGDLGLPAQILAVHSAYTTGGSAMAPLLRARVSGGVVVGPAITGTITVESPQGAYPFYTIARGRDNRNAAGTFGTIQLVQARLTYGYRVSPAPAPLDGSASIASLEFGVGVALRTTLNFVPEPSQAVLSLAGLSALAALWRLRRGPSCP